MSDLYDYLGWRGDISFSDLGVCEADYIVFCAISYLPFDGLVSEDLQTPVRLGDAIKRMRELVPQPSKQKKTKKAKDVAEKETPDREYLFKGDDRLTELITDSPRFADIEMSGFVNRIDTGSQKQFCAMTYRLPTGDIVVNFRGTDDTIVGWKEDFNMGFMSELPSQKDAVEYLSEAAGAFPRSKIYVCGHSKGGNLAMYSAFFCSAKVQRRIVSVRNLDGPGFIEEVLEKEGPKGILGRTKTYVPQSSVVGMLLSHEEPYHVVHSTNYALMQHKLNSWEIRRGEPVGDEGTTNSSQLIDRTLKQWVSEMSIEQRGKLIDGIYEVVSTADAKTLSELTKGKSTVAIIKAMSKLDDEKKVLFRTAYKIFKESLKQSLPTGTLFSSSARKTADT